MHTIIKQAMNGIESDFCIHVRLRQWTPHNNCTLIVSANTHQWIPGYLGPKETDSAALPIGEV